MEAGTTTERGGEHPPAAAPDRDEVAAGTSATMRAIVQDTYGGIEVLRLAQTEVPPIEAGEVLVRVRAAGLDRGTWHFMTGRPYLMRIMGFGLRSPKNRVAGLDVAGTVVAVGADVTRFRLGDEVFGISRGSFAAYAATREDKLAHRPSSLTFEQAAAVPISAITALQALRDAGRLEAAQQVLVIGASGGVGSYAVQMAVALDAHVTGVCSTTKVDFVRSLGAERVIDYTKDDFADGSLRYDLIVDIGGNSRLRRLRRALTPHGTLVIVGGESRGRWTGGFGRQLRAVALSPLVRQRLTMQMTKEHYADIERVAELIDAGVVMPSIERTFRLDQVPDAMRLLESGQVRGKVAITLCESPTPGPNARISI
jgi:NADPH:quinone reductase-like Zn-dependent oxidoreductase